MSVNINNLTTTGKSFRCAVIQFDWMKRMCDICDVYNLFLDPKLLYKIEYHVVDLFMHSIGFGLF